MKRAIFAYIHSKQTQADKDALTDVLTTLLTQARQQGRDDTAKRIHKPTKEGFPGFGNILDRVKGVVQSVIEFSAAFNGDDEYDGMSDEDYADFVAGDEVHGQVQYGALDVYDEYGLPIISVCEPDACEMCQDNADAGPLAAGNAFPSGDTSSPFHNRCRCHLERADTGDDMDDI